MSTVAASVRLPVASGNRATTHPGVARVGRILGLLALGFASTLVLWTLFVHLVDLDPLVRKTPGDVWRYLTSDPKAGEHRATMRTNLGVTLTNMAIGYVIGLITAIIISSLFVLSIGFRRTFMPFALLLRSVPLIAMLPIIGLIFGYTFTSVRVVTAIVTFFPSLVNITFGLESAPKQAADLVSAYGGNSRVTLLKVRLPYAVPSLFAAMRIAVPGAMVGALLGEWLLTTKGIGHYLVKAPASFDYTGVWASVAVVTAITLLLYAIVGIIETPVLARFAPERLNES